MNDDASHTATQQATAPAHTTGKRRRGLLVLAVVAIVGVVAYGSYWFLVARHYESTDDAYVNGDLVEITSEVPGTVMALSADDTQGVRRGQTLLELDPADAKVAMNNADAGLARAVREVRNLFATADQLRARITERAIELKRAQDGAVSSEELSHTQDNIAQLRASLAEAREQLKAITVRIDGTTVESHPQVLAAEAAVRDAALALRRTRIFAPVAGVVARRSVQVGQ